MAAAILAGAAVEVARPTLVALPKEDPHLEEDNRPLQLPSKPSRPPQLQRLLLPPILQIRGLQIKLRNLQQHRVDRVVAMVVPPDSQMLPRTRMLE